MTDSSQSNSDEFLIPTYEKVFEDFPEIYGGQLRDERGFITYPEGRLSKIINTIIPQHFLSASIKLFVLNSTVELDYINRDMVVLLGEKTEIFAENKIKNSLELSLILSGIKQTPGLFPSIFGTVTQANMGFPDEFPAWRYISFVKARADLLVENC